jgi:hypothetical protein
VLREGVRLSRRHRAWLYWCFALLFVTGVLWLAFHYLVRVEGEFGEARQPLEPWWLKLHRAAAMVFLMIVGSAREGPHPNGLEGAAESTGGSLAGRRVRGVDCHWLGALLRRKRERPSLDQRGTLGARTLRSPAHHHARRIRPARQARARARAETARAAGRACHGVRGCRRNARHETPTRRLTMTDVRAAPTRTLARAAAASAGTRRPA